MAFWSRQGPRAWTNRNSHHTSVPWPDRLGGRGLGDGRVHIRLDVGGRWAQGAVCSLLPPTPVQALCEKVHSLCPDPRAGLDPPEQVSLPIWGKEWLQMAMGFLAVTKHGRVTGKPSLGQPPDTSIRCLTMSRTELFRVSHVESSQGTG